MFNDNLANKTAIKYGISLGTAGLNAIPNWIENDWVGVSYLGVPYSDAIEFSLVENIFQKK